MKDTKETTERPAQVVYIVTCYQSVVGVYSSQEDASAAQLDLIRKNRPADVLCRPILKPFNAQ